jgi:histidinol-phosphate phosphatase family protein
VNTDESIKRYKGDNRPIIHEKHRLKVIAALESVDYVFLFNERRNKINIETLKPNFYIKAGDYDPNQLTSKEVVEKYGGEVRLIQIEDDISTSKIIEEISNSTSSSRDIVIEKKNTVHIEQPHQKQSPAIFLDRDGTINEEIMYLHESEKFKLLPNVLQGIKKLYDMGYKIIILTNQPGIGMGYFSKEDFYRVNREMLKQFSSEGILVDKIYFCHHSKSEKCNCRKPGQLLVERAKQDMAIEISYSYIIGDKTSDMETGKRAGMKTILVQTGYKGKDGEFNGEPDFYAKDLLDAANWILKNERE